MIFSLVKLILLIGFFLVLQRYPGQIHVDWHLYEVDMSFATFIFLFIILVYIILMLSRFFGSIFFSTERWQRGRKIKSMRQAMDDTAKALMSLCIDQPEKSLASAKKLDKSKMTSLSLGIKVLANRQAGNEEELQNNYNTMLGHKETELAGMVGLSGISAQNKDYDSALNYIKKAYQKYPKELSLLRQKFQLESALKNWEESLKTLQEYRDCGGIKEAEFRKLASQTLTLKSYEQFEQGDLNDAVETAAKAYKRDASVPATVVHYAYLLTKKSDDKHAIKVLTKAWENEADKLFVKGFKKVISKKPPKEALKLIEKFIRPHPDNKESSILMAQTYLRARDHAKAKEALKPWTKEGSDDLRVARVMLEIEKENNGAKSKQADYWRDMILSIADPIKK